MKIQTSLILTLFILALPVTTLALPSKNEVKPSAQVTDGFNCFDLRKASQKLPVHVSNLSNVNTTRTPEGGAYKRVDISCKEMYCETVAKADFKLMYDRNHPDANQSGYVQLPVINVGSEYAALQSAAAEIRLLAANRACGASAISTNNMALVKYDSGASIQTDTFTFTNDGRLTSWSRVLRDGTAKHVSFSGDGSIIR